MTTSEERSPLKDMPLRLPGQGLQEQRQALIEDKLEPWLLWALFACLLAALEWWRAWSAAPPAPWLYSGFAAVSCALAAWRFVRMRPRLRALRLGMQGERAVGQFLDRLRARGYQVLHDVQGDGFNLDHVCIGPEGVFSIETKTWSKPVRGDARIHYDGSRLTIQGKAPDRDPIAQARAQAAWLARLLNESSGRTVRVRPVVVFPGWFVEADAGAHREVWVLEPKALPAFLEREAPCLAPEDVKLLAFHLARVVRADERQRPH